MLEKVWRKLLLKESSLRDRLTNHWLIFKIAIMSLREEFIWAQIQQIDSDNYKILTSIMRINKTKRMVRILIDQLIIKDKQNPFLTNSWKNDTFIQIICNQRQRITKIFSLSTIYWIFIKLTWFYNTMINLLWE